MDQFLAWARAEDTASLAAPEVTVAPETPSMAAPLALALAARVSSAAPPMAGVSSAPVRVTEVITSSAMVTVAVTLPPKPWAEAVYVPS